MIVIFDRQHYGKPSGTDLGAGVDLDHDGDVEAQEREANLTPLYYLPAKRTLEALGQSVYVIDSGWYSDRHDRANSIAWANQGQKVAYVACHINAGKGDYSVMIHDQRSTNGSRLALSLSAAMADHSISGIERNLVRAATADNAWSRAYSTIKGIYSGPANISGVCLEPYFLDREAHQWLATPEGGEAIAEALVSGLMDWGRNGSCLSS
jgi:hypothetical protein